VVLAYLDFLDSREKAVLVWTLIALAWALIKVDGFLASVGGILRVLCGKLLLPFVLLAGYCAGVVIAA
jgi:type IV secretory pathway TrbL component